MEKKVVKLKSFNSQKIGLEAELFKNVRSGEVSQSTYILIEVVSSSSLIS